MKARSHRRLSKALHSLSNHKHCLKMAKSLAFYRKFAYLLVPLDLLLQGKMVLVASLFRVK